MSYPKLPNNTFSNGHITSNYFVMYLAKWKWVAVLLLCIIGILVTSFVSPLRCNESSYNSIELQNKLSILSLQIEALKLKRTNIVDQIRKLASRPLTENSLEDLDPQFRFMSTLLEPPEEYENLRRRVYTNTKELWYYVRKELSKAIKKKDNKMHRLMSRSLKRILDEVSARKNSLLSDQDKMSKFDGHHEWRQAEAANVSDLIQRRLHYLQNPPNCKKARKVICYLQNCGFGCQLHHITANCLIYAYATKRTLIYNSNGFQYNSHSWDHDFYPLSETCTSALTVYNDHELRSQHSSESNEDDAKVISLSSSQLPEFRPQAVPEDLARRIVKFNGDPASWWVGQMIKYVLKPRHKLQKAINKTIANMDFKTPIVGIHIRRTDKLNIEASFHYIDEYMHHVRQYYDQLELTAKVDVRRVYLASDDAKVLYSARKKYPDYVFLGNVSIARSAFQDRRYTPESLRGLLVDLYMLARTDYLVCTFSSNICRQAYEMMQSNRVDASNSVSSLDDVYYCFGQVPNNRRVVVQHPGGGAAGDIELKVNDLVGVAGNHWNGYGLGTNIRTNVTGLFPWYKTAPHLVMYPFPEYKEVPLHTDRVPFVTSGVVATVPGGDNTLVVTSGTNPLPPERDLPLSDI